MVQTATISRLRLLAGIESAFPLAEAIAGRFSEILAVDIALHGVRRVGPGPGCRVDRIGGCAPGAGAALMVDALNPFDRDRVRAGREAARRSGVPRLAYRLPAWDRHPLDRWIEVRDLAGAVASAPAVARTALLALPLRDLAAFEPVGGLRFPVPVRERPPRWPLPPRFAPLDAPAPRSVPAELALLRRCQAQAVVMRATGDPADRPLAIAARTLDLPVVMIRRPSEPTDIPAGSIEVTLDWVAAMLSTPKVDRSEVWTGTDRSP